MQNKFRRIFADVEQIIITSLLENRYSHQVVRSIKVLADEIDIPVEQLDCSVNSLSLIDDYLNNLKDKEKSSLEVYLSITIYFSQVLILSCNGVWAIETDGCLLPGRCDFYAEDESIWVYSLTMEIYPTGSHLYPHYLVIDSISDDKSELQQKAITVISSLENREIEEMYFCRYELSGLGTLIDEGFDFYTEIPSLISKLADFLDIPEKKLNKSVASLKLVSERVHVYEEDFLCDQEYFDEISVLALAVYIGEVIIKAINGRWELSSKKIHIVDIRKYRWTMKIFNSQNLELTRFLFDIGNCLREYACQGFRADLLAKYYIRADDRQQDDTIWRDTKPCPKKRIWKQKLSANPWDKQGSTVKWSKEIDSLSKVNYVLVNSEFT
jgi:hypothetical protein